MTKQSRQTLSESVFLESHNGLVARIGMTVLRFCRDENVLQFRLLVPSQFKTQPPYRNVAFDCVQLHGHKA